MIADETEAAICGLRGHELHKERWTHDSGDVWGRCKWCNWAVLVMDRKGVSFLSPVTVHRSADLIK